MYKRVYLIVVLISLSLVAGAQVSFSSLEDVWKYADAHNIGIRVAGYELNKGQYAKKQSYMAFLPQVAANGSYLNNTSLQTTLLPGDIFGTPGTYRAVQFGQKYVYTATLSAQMDIVNLQTWYNVTIAKETDEMNKASLANTKKAAYQQIAMQYYGYLLYKEAARLATLSETTADSVLQSVANKYKEGIVNLASLDISKLNKERATQTRVGAEFQAMVSKNTLKGLLELPVTDSLAIEATLQSSLSNEVPGAFSEDPAVRLAYSQSKINLSTFKAANSNYFPTLSVSYSNNTQQFDNKFEPFQQWPAWYPSSYWLVKATWNIFTGGSRWVQSKKSKINYYESKEQFENTQLQSAINDENLRLSYQKAAAVLTHSQNVMSLSFDNYRHISNRYYEGLATLDERLNAFTDYISYQNLYLNNLSDMLIQLYLVKIRTITIQ
jgi:outer membrane protein